MGHADHSIPLTLMAKLAMERGSFSEMLLRALPMAAGLLLLIFVPRWLGPAIGARAAWIFAAILAMSPVLIQYARTARPYAPALLLALAAIIALQQYVGSPKKRYLAACAIAAALAAWLHLTALIPIALAGVAVLLQGALYRDLLVLKRVIVVGVVSALVAAPLLMPPLLDNPAALANKASTGEWDYGVLWRAWLLVCGTGSAWVGVVMVAFASLGVVTLWRRQRAFCFDWLVIVAGSWVFVIAVNPAWVEHAPVPVRYTLVATTGLLMFVACGLAAIAGRLPNMGAAACVAAALVLVAATGPLPSQFGRYNQLPTHAVFTFDFHPERNVYVQALEPDTAPEIYRYWSHQPGRWRVVHAPWRIEWHANDTVYAQQQHAQRILGGYLSGLCRDVVWGELNPRNNGARLAHNAHLADADLATRAHYVVFDLDAPWPGDVPKPDLNHCVAEFAQRWGAACHAEPSLRVFALTRAARVECAGLSSLSRER